MKKLFTCYLLCFAASLVACEPERPTKFVSTFKDMGVHPDSSARPAELGSHSVPPSPDEATVLGRVNMANYQRLKTGMSYKQATAILGSNGVELSSNDIGGSHTVMYQWKAGTMANMNAMFQQNKLISKAQFGLE